MLAITLLNVINPSSEKHFIKYPLKQKAIFEKQEFLNTKLILNTLVLF